MYLCLKWETEMMTSRLRATVSREKENITIFRNTASDQEDIGFLQEALKSCGKQSSAPSFIRDYQRAAALAAFRPELSHTESYNYIISLTISSPLPSLSLYWTNIPPPAVYTSHLHPRHHFPCNPLCYSLCLFPFLCPTSALFHIT